MLEPAADPLLSLDGIQINSRVYRAGLVQAPHRDRTSRISAVLSGGFSEETKYGSLRCGRGDLLLKSRSIVHENAFVDRSTRILSIEFVSGGSDGVRSIFQRAAWRVLRQKPGLRALVHLLEAVSAGDVSSAEAFVLEMVLTFGEETPQRSPPPWLCRIADELESVGLSQVRVAERARAAGVHPVHASRLFRECFGRSVTEHARYHAVRRALAGMEREGARLCDVSSDAGFFDQSHMTRAFRQMTDRPPAACRTLFDAAG